MGSPAAPPLVQAYTLAQHVAFEHTWLLYGRHVDQALLCCLYAVCKVGLDLLGSGVGLTLTLWGGACERVNKGTCFCGASACSSTLQPPAMHALFAAKGATRCDAATL